MPAKKKEERFPCDKVEGEKFHAGNDEIFKYNWWEVFCFPYILCTRFWDCCISLCTGTNQCLVYWMMIQWIICKITRITTPDAIIFPYYFYMFCQVILLTAFFVLLWLWIGNNVIVPYFVAFYVAFTEEEEHEVNETEPQFRFRKYCFRKGEIFDTTAESGTSHLSSGPINVLALAFDLVVNRVLY